MVVVVVVEPNTGVVVAGAVETGVVEVVVGGVRALCGEVLGVPAHPDKSSVLRTTVASASEWCRLNPMERCTFRLRRSSCRSHLPQRTGPSLADF